MSERWIAVLITISVVAILVFWMPLVHLVFRFAVNSSKIVETRQRSERDQWKEEDEQTYHQR